MNNLPYNYPNQNADNLTVRIPHSLSQNQQKQLKIPPPPPQLKSFSSSSSSASSSSSGSSSSGYRSQCRYPLYHPPYSTNTSVVTQQQQQQQQPPPPSQTSFSTNMLPNVVMDYAIVLENFISEGSTELSVNRGDFVQVFYHINQKWAYVCRQIDKTVGYIPYLYCAFVRNVNVASNNTINAENNESFPRQQIQQPLSSNYNRGLSKKQTVNTPIVSFIPKSTTIKETTESCSSGCSSSIDSSVTYASSQNTSNHNNNSRYFYYSDSEDSCLGYKQTLPTLTNSDESIIRPPSPYNNNNNIPNTQNNNLRISKNFRSKLSHSQSFSEKMSKISANSSVNISSRTPTLSRTRRYSITDLDDDDDNNNNDDNGESYVGKRDNKNKSNINKNIVLLNPSGMINNKNRICEPYQTIVNELEDCLEKLTLV